MKLTGAAREVRFEDTFMVSLYISRLGKRIQMSGSPADTYEILRRAGYLSYRAIRDRASVIALMEHTADEYERKLYGPMPGDELWRHIQSELVAHKYLSLWGRLWGCRYVSRGAT
jgi:hypothetical protein